MIKYRRHLYPHILMEKKPTLFWALKPFYFYSKILGLAPINCDNKGVSYCILGHLINLLMIVTSFAWLIWRLTNLNFDQKNDQVLHHFIEISHILLVFGTVFSFIYYSICTKKNIHIIINKIIAADELLYGDQTDTIYRQNRRFLFFEMTLIVFLHFVYWLYKIWFNYGKHPFMLFKFIMYFVNSIINLQLINWLFLLKQRFRKIEDNLNDKDWHSNEFERKFLLFRKRIEVIPKEDYTKKM